MRKPDLLKMKELKVNANIRKVIKDDIGKKVKAEHCYRNTYYDDF